MAIGHSIGVGQSQGELARGSARDEPWSPPGPTSHLPGSHRGRPANPGAQQEPPLGGAPRIGRSSIVTKQTQVTKQTHLEA
jgi:hypothetical protein